MRKPELAVDEGSSAGGVLMDPVRNDGSFYHLAVVEGGEVWEDSKDNESVLIWVWEVREKVWQVLEMNSRFGFA